MIVAFTGHRPEKLGGWNPLNPVVSRVRNSLHAALLKHKPLYTISGMALGTDQWAAEACIELGIPYIAAVPCDDMDRMWPAPARTRFKMIIDKAREVVVVSPGPYQPWKMQRRNEYMVDHCNLLIACHDGSPGGTKNCLEYAAQVGRDVELLDWH